MERGDFQNKLVGNLPRLGICEKAAENGVLSTAPPKQTLTVKVGHYSFPLGIEMIVVCPSRKRDGKCWPSHRTFIARNLAPPVSFTSLPCAQSLGGENPYIDIKDV